MRFSRSCGLASLISGALIAGIQITFIGALVGSVTESVLSGILWRLFATDGKW